MPDPSVRVAILRKRVDTDNAPGWYWMVLAPDIFDQVTPSTEESHAYESVAPGNGVPVSVAAVMEVMSAGALPPAHTSGGLLMTPPSSGHPAVKEYPVE